MDTNKLNIYGDKRVATASGHGVDIAIQRTDDLDNLAISRIVALCLLGKSVTALDVGGGRGGQAVRMAMAGASLVVNADLFDYEKETTLLASRHGVEDKVRFAKADMRSLSSDVDGALLGMCDVVVCQRAIHYLAYPDAKAAVLQMRAMLKDDGVLYISASGMASELSSGYPGKSVAFEERFAPLAEDMADKHAIRGNVCLYNLEDMHRLLQEAGMCVDKIWNSPFGNVKAVARKA